MNPSKTTARLVGYLFIAATVTGALALLVLIQPVLDDPDYLVQISADENRVLTGVLLEFLSAVAVAGIGITLFPVFRDHNETLATAYVGARIIESVYILVGALAALLLVTLSLDHVAGASNASVVEPLGALLVAVRDWTNVLGPILVLGLHALILNYFWYQTGFVPRWLWVWGFAAAAFILVAGVLRLFGLDQFSPLSVLLSLPIAVYEMVLAVWLIVKGFRSSAIASEPA